MGEDGGGGITVEEGGGGPSRSVRFSGDEPDVRRIFTEEYPGDNDYGDEENNAGCGTGLVQDLSRTSVRADELEPTDEDEDYLQLGSSTDMLPRKKSFAYQMARAWEVKPENVLIENLLGNGAYGQVYKGKWSGTDVAVKIVQEDLVYQQEYIATQDISDAMKVFWAEVKLMRTLSHPNVVQFLGACTRRHPRMLLMEYLPNGTLEDVFEEAQMRNRPLGLDLATKYAIDAAKGIAYLHHNPHRTVIHRDIKPGNLLIDRTGSIKVADFGLSKAVDESILAIHLKELGDSLRDSVSDKEIEGTARRQMKIRKKKPFEQRGYQVGTYIYMPAELFRSKSDYTSKVDVYSYAMILYELYEGRQPFEEYGANPMYAAAAAAAGVRPEMHRTPKCVREIIEKCWAEEPKERPTFLEILKDLELVDAMIKYDTSARFKVIVTINFCIHLLWFFLTCGATACEFYFLAKARDEGLQLYHEGRKAGIISAHAKSAFTDPVVVSFIFFIPILMALASLMFLVVPNKKIRAISRRGPKFSRRKGVVWKGLRKCCGGALEVLRRVTLVSSVLSVCTVMLQYLYDQYILGDICNGDSVPFEPPKGIDKGLCERNYANSHMAILFQWILLSLNITQLLFHHFGMPEPKITPRRFDLDYVTVRQHFETAASESEYDESSPLLGKSTPVSARQFYRIRRETSTDDIGTLMQSENLK
ncbi:serine/threonine-protein kinase [Chloropicon primus]|uniref:Serine/threonine-protein kinase n=1 Tax=Chloropicon primus TaxID=1764295 RepID=A0A5B8MU60_9CHLO|nr:serine/threonine-protein kinase [Chloropicon primus]UPR02506.1 serine/threonine-protein kinase [Chloropicon primus]|eukprot:QDZ23294.1 serine/threonine-protein kinase [Chloropicon primus]